MRQIDRIQNLISKIKNIEKWRKVSGTAKMKYSNT